MPKYKILEDFVMNGVPQVKDTIVEISSFHASLNSIKGKIEKAPEVKGDSSVLSAVIPGVPLTPEQKEKLAKENVAISAQAHQQAAEQNARDVQEGKATPPVTAIAETIKEQLENKFPAPAPAPTDETPVA